MAKKINFSITAFPFIFLPKYQSSKTSEKGSATACPLESSDKKNKQKVSKK